LLIVPLQCGQGGGGGGAHYADQGHLLRGQAQTQHQLQRGADSQIREVRIHLVIDYLVN